MRLRRLLVALGLASILFAIGITFIPWVNARYWLSFGLLWIVPGLAWGTLLLRKTQPCLEKFCVSLGLNFALTPVSMLILSYLPGPVTRVQILLAMVALSGIPMLIACARPRAFDRATEGGLPAMQADASLMAWLRRYVWLLLVLVGVAAALRWVNLGYSEFQGDESTVMILAARVLQGEPSAMFEHNKGPAELLTVAAGWRLTGISNEWMARLPFSWANVLAIVTAGLIAQRITSTSAGLFTVMLLGIEGYVLALGRIAQYQSLVLVLSMLALLCLLEFLRSGRFVLVVVAAVLLAGAGLAHYDAVLVLPSCLLILAARLWRDRRRGRVWLTTAAAGLLAIAVLALYYGPSLQSHHYGNISSYLSKRVGSGLRNNLAQVFVLSTVYDSIYLLGILAVGVLAQAWRAWRRFGRLGGVAASVLIVWGMGVFVRSVAGGAIAVTLAVVPFWILLIGTLVGLDQSWPQRALWLWLAVPASFYLFYVVTPYTHVHTFFVPAVIVTGSAIADLAERVQGQAKALRRVALAAGGLAYAVCGYYAIHMFVQHTPEYRRTFPEHKIPIYWTPYDEIPDFGLFGFPYRAGWKAVEQLIEAGELSGDYESNEEPPITNYYLRAVPRWHCPTPSMYVTAVNVQDEIFIRWDQIEQDYRPAFFVTVEGEPKIAVHTIDAVGEPEWVPAEAYGRHYDLGTTPDRVAQSALWFPKMVEPKAEPLTLRDFYLGEDIRLVGYHLDTHEVTAGSFFSLTLVWEARASDIPDYTVFTHLQGDGYLWGQLDGLPECGERPTASWEEGDRIVDHYRIPVRVDTPAGEYPLRVGMYDRTTMERVSVVSGDGRHLGDGVHLADITVNVP